MFITVFTSVRHWSVSWARRIQSTPSHPISVRPILILFSYPRLVLPSVLFPPGFQKILYAFLTSSTSATCSANLILLHLTTLNNILWNLTVRHQPNSLSTMFCHTNSTSSSVVTCSVISEQVSIAVTLYTCIGNVSSLNFFGFRLYWLNFSCFSSVYSDIFLCCLLVEKVSCAVYILINAFYR
jgi:hypothetical protein